MKLTFNQSKAYYPSQYYLLNTLLIQSIKGLNRKRRLSRRENFCYFSARIWDTDVFLVYSKHWHPSCRWQILRTVNLLINPYKNLIKMSLYFVSAHTYTYILLVLFQESQYIGVGKPSHIHGRHSSLRTNGTCYCILLKMRQTVLASGTGSPNSWPRNSITSGNLHSYFFWVNADFTDSQRETE